ncbi:hypothetical protein F2P79_006885 [Pimephales promelas]|nr:hypothetical protein F2P79_006885 [Pimephales promelas]
MSIDDLGKRLRELSSAGAFVSSRGHVAKFCRQKLEMKQANRNQMRRRSDGYRPQPSFSPSQKQQPNCQYTWTRLPQGFRDSPAVFSSVVHDTLKDVKLPPDTCLLQYADDILVTGASEDMCAAASKIVCNILAEAGFKASKEKLQWVQRKVTYLGHELSQGKVRLSADRIKAIATFKHPSTRKQMQSFLGLVNYCRLWVPNCSKYDKILREATLGDMEDITWTSEMNQAFRHLKSSLLRPPALGLPCYTQDFHLYVYENGGTAAAILAQEHGGTFRPVAYLSKTLDSVARGLPACLRAVAATAVMIQDAEKVVLSHPLIVHVSHQVGMLASVGGRDTKSVMFNSLAHIFADSAAKSINWKGMNNKKKFSEMATKAIMARAVRKNRTSDKATDTEMNHYAIRWFNLACDRGGGRRARSHPTNER